MKKPHVICHMMSTINGKINWGNDPSTKVYSEIYEKCHERFESQAWIVGRVTMEKHFSEEAKPIFFKPEKPIERKHFIGDLEATSFAIAIDAKGKLHWDNNEISGDHIIEVLTEQVSDDYLHYLQQQKVSYIFAGKKEMDFQLALQQLKELFHIETLMLEGGGLINGSLLNEGLVDEISLLMIPVAYASSNVPTTFEFGDYKEKNLLTHFQLNEVKQLEHDVLWLRYKLES